MDNLVAVVRQHETGEIVDALVKKQVHTSTKRLSDDLLTKWSPLTHYIELVVTGELRNYFSEEEIQQIETLNQANVRGKPLNNPSATRIECNLRDTVKLEYTKGILIQCFRRYRGDVTIVTGEAHYKIYDEEIYDTIIRATKESPNKPKIVCGPILLVNDKFRNNRTEGSILPQLMKSGSINLWYSDKRQGVHFRLGGPNTLYIEDPHLAGAQTRFGWLFENDSNIGSRFEATADFIYKSQDVKKSKDPSSDFLFLTSSELFAIKKACNEELSHGGKPYDEYTKQEFTRIIKKYQIYKS